MIKVFNSIIEWRQHRESISAANYSFGFVPTMGALHEGHLSLIKRSINENDKTIVSIFINPTQFNDPKDLEKYPRSIEKDLDKLKSLKVDYVIIPQNEEIYKDEYRYVIKEKVLSKKLCGVHRQGHFDGVLTVVMKLLNIAKADKAYFGEKDYQQYLLIKGMAEAFFIDTEIIPCKLIREDDGLAMSSRNELLSEKDRKIAPKLYHQLKDTNSIEEIKNNLAGDGFKVEYIEEMDNRRLVAVHLGKVRLIDNVEI